VVALKVGRTAVGKEAAQSHTGRLTGDEDVYRALFEESGVAVAESYEQLHDVAQRVGFVGGRAGRGRRGAIVTTSGGTGIVAADVLVEAGWTLPQPTESTRVRLAAAGANPPGNPLDVTGGFQVRDRLGSLVGVLGESGEYDEIFLLSGSGGASAEDMAVHIGAAVKSLATPVTCSWIAPPSESVVRTIEAAGAPVYPDPTRAIRAASAHVATVPSARERDEAESLLQLLGKAPVSPGAHARGPSAYDLFTELGEAGVPCAPCAAVVPDAPNDELLSVAHRIGYPVVLKIDGSLGMHKTEVGGVITRIGNDDELLQARDRLRKVLPGGDPDGQLLVQRMLSGVEVLVGARRDPSFGHVLALGLGGVQAELLADVRTVLLPTTATWLDRALDGHARLATLLGGYRGAEPADLAALRRTVHALADWVSGPGSAYAEVDFNPVMATPSGAFVVDARVIAGGDEGAQS